jgi:hypothetical protein
LTGRPDISPTAIKAQTGRQLTHGATLTRCEGEQLFVAPAEGAQSPRPRGTVRTRPGGRFGADPVGPLRTAARIARRGSPCPDEGRFRRPRGATARRSAAGRRARHPSMTRP